MPPPRLPRHLRPCHPPGTAHQARCAHKTARAKCPTNGDDAPQNPSNATPRDATPWKTSWWGAAMRSIALFGFRSASAEPNPQPSPSPALAPPRPSEGKNEGMPKENAQEGSDGLTRNIKMPESHQKNNERAAPYQQPKREEEADGGGHPSMVLRKGLTGKETTVPSHMKPARSFPGVTGRREKDNSGVEKRGPSEHGDLQEVERKEGTVVSSKEKPTDVPQQDDTMTTIQQQLQQLFEHVRALQATLEANSAAGQPPSTHPTFHELQSKTPSPADARQRISKVDTAAPHTATKTISDERRPKRKWTSRPLHVLGRAWAAYRASTDHLGEAAKALASGHMPSHVIAPLSSSLLQRLRAIERDAATENDRFTRRIVGKYQGALRILADGLNQPMIVYTTPPNPPTSTVSSAMEANSGGSDNTGRKAWSVTLPVHSDDIGYVPRLCGNRYRVSTRVLANTGNALEARYSPILCKQPTMSLRLRAADVLQRTEKAMAALRPLEAEILRIAPLTRNIYVPGKQRDLGGLRSENLGEASEVKGASAGAFISQTKPRKRAVVEEKVMDDEMDTNKSEAFIMEKKNDGQRLTRQIHTQSRLMKSSDHSKIISSADQETIKAEKPAKARSNTPLKPVLNTKYPTAKGSLKATSLNDEISEQSLLEELFPEAVSPPQPRYSEKRDQYPKLDLPDSTPIIRRELVDRPQTLKQKVVESIQNKGEQITVLQLVHCSTGLTEVDFRRLIPKGKHIEAWRREGEFFKIIPGRDPLSLERMPFYYILFKDAESALAYQKNASRIHKLSALHQPANIFSAIPPPRGFLEDGEDITAITSSYNLVPTHHQLSLNVLMQPYNPALRALIERGGYQPIMPNVDEKGQRIWKVLMHIEGYEPTPSDLFKIFSRDAYVHGIPLPLRNESYSAIHRLRDIINLEITVKSISSANPRAYGSFQHQVPSEPVYADPAVHALLAGAEDSSAKEMNQLVMNRLYNRWVVEFEDEDSARRWAVGWHRKVLPELSGGGKGAWKDGEEQRVCNTEVLW
ncbi:hypothetical protein EJ02DRAFT_449520 [Clathrospora elynae]|uniref:Uncharacterized protein n=1 Tax=Clathrospora elynae TaxID=706981 RepID=A0A6A5T798_9PLEO|nr:hypothetical protein EJ02DRAFT_449520 [Clathrospora elynae]